MRSNSKGIDKVQRPRYTRIVFTINGPQDRLKDDFAKLKTLRSPVKWMICGRETCPMTGSKHLQGAMLFDKRVYRTTIKKMAGMKYAWFERMKGSPEASLKYCSKEDDEFYEFGSCPKNQPGKRNDIHDTIDMMRSGISTDQFILTAPTSMVAAYVRYPRGLTRVSQTYRTQGHKHPPLVVWLHGSTGTGKTRSVVDFTESLGENVSIWISHGTLQWFDGYEQQDVVLFDDYRTNHASFAFLLRLLDRYPIQAPFKGGFTDFRPKIIFVTAPKSPRVMWNLRTEEDLQQLDRRVHVTIDVDEFLTYNELRNNLIKSILELSDPDESHHYLSEFLNPLRTGGSTVESTSVSSIRLLGSGSESDDDKRSDTRTIVNRGVSIHSSSEETEDDELPEVVPTRSGTESCSIRDAIVISSSSSESQD